MSIRQRTAIATILRQYNAGILTSIVEVYHAISETYINSKGE